MMTNALKNSRTTRKVKNKARISVAALLVSVNVNAGPEHQFQYEINKAALQHKLPVALIIEVIKAESDFDQKAVSLAGAKGLMQLMDKTANQYGVTDSFNPGQNINAGSKHLRDLFDKYNSIRFALAAYNAGTAAVDQYKGVPPYKETKGYIARISRGYRKRTGRSF